jgi:hypothetical protein
MYKLVDEDGNEVNKCYFNGYNIASRFLEDCYFRVSLNDMKTEIVVEATHSTQKYLLAHKADVAGWEQDVKNYKFLDESLTTSPTSNSLSVYIEQFSPSEE